MTREDPILPPLEAYSRDKRKQTMRKAVCLMASANALHSINAHKYAETYGIAVVEVESEIIKCLPEGDGK